jgi:hypothetical protein
MPDHCHLFVQADQMTAPGEIVKTLKSISAVYIFTKFPDLKKRKFWGRGCGVQARLYLVLVIFPKMLLGSILKLKSSVVDLANGGTEFAPPFIRDSTCGARSSRRV